MPSCGSKSTGTCGRASDPAPKGWGSFHSEREDERVEVLIRKPESEYKPPALAVPLDAWWRAFPVPGSEAAAATDSSPAVVPFGAETKRALFHLEPSWAFLNHGAFGAALRPVVAAARAWHDRMEAQPLRFIDREMLPLLVYVTRETAKYFNAPALDVVMLANATTGLNTVFRSLGLRAGERVATLDLGYGATDKMLKHVCAEAGAVHDRIGIPLPVPSVKALVGAVKRYFIRHRPARPEGKSAEAEGDGAGAAAKDGSAAGTKDDDAGSAGDALVDASGNAVTAVFGQDVLPVRRGTARDGGVRLLVLDYVNSNSGVRLPLAELIAACRAEGVEVLVDGAHCWGSLEVDLAAIKPTYFVANAHKWLCASKGCAMLYVAPAAQAGIVPLNISHGHGGGFTSSFTWTGLQDYGPWLALLTAFDFWRRAGPERLRGYIHSTVLAGARLLCERWGTELIAPEEMMLPMATVRLPGPRVPRSGSEHTQLQDALHFRFGVEAPVRMLNNRLYVRVSAHIYTDLSEFERLADAMLELRPRLSAEEDEADKEAAENAEVVKPDSGC